MLRFIGISLSLLMLAGIIGGAVAAFVLWSYARELPDYRQLAVYEPPVMSRVHAADGTLIAEYARERRLFVPIETMPKVVIDAFLSAEDKTFYQHPGVDLPGILGAVLINVKNLGSDRRPVGASTITQQVAKNFLLTNEVSLARKVKEAILAFRIENAFSKDRILELYLNEIYLGFGSYGVAAASLNYFDKSLDELTVPEAAYLAALPKAPSNYHPIRRPEAARQRRDWVLGQMADNGVIDDSALKAYRELPLEVRPPEPAESVNAANFAEEVRREMVDRYGDKGLYEGGLSIRSTLDGRLQQIAHEELRKGLRDYDRRHGWRGPIATLTEAELAGNWAEAVAALPKPDGLAPWDMAVALKVGERDVEIGLADGRRGLILFDELRWARPWMEGQLLGPSVRRAGDVVDVGDVVAVEPVVDLRAEEDRPAGELPRFSLRQIPEINGAIVAMDPHTGRVLAMVGGYSYDASQFNRATQAQRQPGSSFKPFVYAAALDHGFSPNSLVLDAPFVLDQGAIGIWKPENYTSKFYGPSTLRLGIEKSRNLMTVRLAQEVGMPVVIDYARRFGIVDDMPPYLPMALGAGETTLLRLTTAYAMLVNGGKRIVPSLVDRVQDRRGNTIYRHDQRDCPGCVTNRWRGQFQPILPDTREQVISPQTAYQVVNMLQGVVQRGTGIRIRVIGKPLAGKTGTTNESRDAWFMGFAPDLAVGVYTGFDEPKSLGKKETGSSLGVPIFRDFMARALEQAPSTPFRVPPGIKLVRVDARTGMPAEPGDARTIMEAFRADADPMQDGSVLGGAPIPVAGGQLAPERTRAGTGGLY
ncbi:MAG: penicillin-binding protein 1A [Alphaproteobacteria bacterium]